ncbi:MAG: DUF4215 domain-containing protein [Kofleriaceae bacterium]
MLGTTPALAAALAGAVILGLTASPAGAVAPVSRAPSPTVAARHAGGVVVMPGAHIKGTPRAAVRIEHGPGAAGSARASRWARFVAQRGAGWEASWDRATAVPSRVWGPGIASPGVMASAAAAEGAAWAALAAHLELLAPGAALTDFELVSNVSDGDQRSVGFVQHHAGLRVVGGQVSVRFKADRLFVLASQALPQVTIARPRARLPEPTLRPRVARTLQAVLGLPQVPTVTPAAGADVILPIIGDDAVLAYRVVSPRTVDAGAAGRWTAWVSPDSGEVVARRAERQYAEGSLRIDAVDRHPGRPRQPWPAQLLEVTVGGQARLTDLVGGVSWSPDGNTTLVPRARGPEVEVDNIAGDEVVGSLPISPGGTATWSGAGDERVDAQLQAFVHTSIVRDYIRRFAPGLDALDAPLVAHVNIEDECNAFFDGESINFFLSSDSCQNSALLADVVYHEVGHWLHRNAIIDGVGAFDGAMSEGLSDFLAASITGDSGMGRGFFYGDAPLRELDPEDGPMWPDDIGEIHTTGIIFGATFWDLRSALITALGEEDGRATVERLFYAAVQRATDIPSSLIEALAADDDDGNLANGTPNECAIRAAFGSHGMRTAYGDLTAPGHVVAVAGQTHAPVTVDVRGASPTCAGEQVTGVELRWQPSVGNEPPRGHVDATAVPSALGERWEASIPLPRDGGRVDYQAWIRFADGGQLPFPDNPADPWYQMSQGEVVPLYCTSFDDDPFEDHWRQGGEGAGWAWGPGDGGAYDPEEPFTGTSFLQLAPGTTYEPDALSWVQLPRIDVGAYSDVHLQYRRWLTVEDGFFDQAEIRANGNLVWTNLDSDNGDRSTTHHVDREWRYIDHGLSTRFAGPLLDLRFNLISDGGLEFGGWNLDDLCVVANPASICGDGVRSPTEECDAGDANGNQPDACRSTCKFATCGDGVLDSDEECDPGAVTPTCTASCAFVDDPDELGGCCGAGGGPAGTLPLGAMVGLLLLRRRRR